MTTGKSVIVKQFPCGFNDYERFLHELEPYLEHDRPFLVFDFGEVTYIDSAGVDLLLSCMEAAIKNNGDLKLASVSSSVQVMLEMTRVDRLFEIFDNWHRRHRKPS